MVRLHPKYSMDRMYVESCGQNPFIKIRLPIEARLERIFTILNAKWIPKAKKVKSWLFFQEYFITILI